MLPTKGMRVQALLGIQIKYGYPITALGYDSTSALVAGGGESRSKVVGLWL